MPPSSVIPAAKRSTDARFYSPRLPSSEHQQDTLYHKDFGSIVFSFYEYKVQKAKALEGYIPFRMIVTSGSA